MPPLSGRVAKHRPRDAHGIDAEMFVEAPILDGDEGFGQIGRQIAEPHRGAAGVAAIGEHAAVDAEDLDVGRPLRHGELVDRRQLARVIGEQAADGDDAPDAEHEAPIDKRSQKRAAAAARALFSFRFSCRRRGIGRSSGSARRSESA